MGVPSAQNNVPINCLTWLTGTFPLAWAAVGALPSLQNLSLPFNNLAGPLPQSLLLPSLSILNLQANFLSGASTFIS
jgi:hypothetical protein